MLTVAQMSSGEVARTRAVLTPGGNANRASRGADGVTWNSVEFSSLRGGSGGVGQWVLFVGADGRVDFRVVLGPRGRSEPESVAWAKVLWGRSDMGCSWERW